MFHCWVVKVQAGSVSPTLENFVLSVMRLRAHQKIVPVPLESRLSAERDPILKLTLANAQVLVVIRLGVTPVPIPNTTVKT